MSTAIAERPEPVGIVITNEQIALIKATVAKDATDAELKLFFYDCQRQGVHPLDRLIHFTKRNGKYTPITSIDFMRLRAADSGEMAGSDDPYFNGQAEGDVPPLSATVTVYRMTQGQRFAYTATARWSEYKPEQNDFMWRKMPHTMLGKCAEALALRKAFPKQLHGLYAKEELEQVGEEAAGASVAAGYPPLAEPLPPPPAAPPPRQPRPLSPPEQRAVEAGKGAMLLISEPQAKRLYAIAKNAGWDDADLKRWLKHVYGYDTRQQIPRRQYDEICTAAQAGPQ